MGLEWPKLDLFESFSSDDTTALKARDGRDHASVYTAVDQPMTDVTTALRAAKPDVLIEFRQAYTGTLIRKYGNMLRASDAPNSSILNKQRIVDLHLLAGSTPVHADPIVWNAAEPSGAAALQLLDTLFAVPQTSMQLGDLKPAHEVMLDLSYRRANRDILASGTFKPEGVGSGYPLIRAASSRKQITGVYGDQVVKVDRSTPAIDVVNATSLRRVVLDVAGDFGSYRLSTTAELGRVTDRRETRLFKGLHAIDVPPAGIISLVQSE